MRRRQAGERLIGWTAHYLIGIGFAAILLLACGPEWASRPTPGPALRRRDRDGGRSVPDPAAGIGAGIAASRTPRPASARIQSVITHTIFGFGMYAAALAFNLLKG
jgi:hypothetical protein